MSNSKANTGPNKGGMQPPGPKFDMLAVQYIHGSLHINNIFNKSRKLNDKNMLQSKKSHQNYNVKKSLGSEVLHLNVHFEKPSFTCRQLTIKYVKHDDTTNAFSWEI